MKNILFCCLLLAFVLTSCYPPRILYSIENVQPFQTDSINVQLIEGSAITAGGLSIYLNLYLEISNNKTSNILINQNSALELLSDSGNLKYEISPDSLVFQLMGSETKLLQLHFHATDFDHITYKAVEWPSIWSFRTHRIETPRHKLFLYMDLQDDKGNKVKKCIILKPTGIKRNKYEEPPF
jgi:hypothetical protein